MAENEIREEKRPSALAIEIHEKFVNKALALTKQLKQFNEEIQLLKSEQSELANELKQTIVEFENTEAEMKFKKHRLRTKACLLCKTCKNTN